MLEHHLAEDHHFLECVASLLVRSRPHQLEARRRSLARMLAKVYRELMILVSASQRF